MKIAIGNDHAATELKFIIMDYVKKMCIRDSYKGMRGFMMNAIYLSAIFAVVMTIVTVIFCMPILELMRTPENIIDGAYPVSYTHLGRTCDANDSSFYPETGKCGTGGTK